MTLTIGFYGMPPTRLSCLHRAKSCFPLPRLALLVRLPRSPKRRLRLMEAIRHGAVRTVRGAGSPTI